MAKQTLKAYIAAELKIATDNADSSEPNTDSGWGWAARVVALRDASYVANNVETDFDSFATAKEYYEVQLKTADHSACDHDPDSTDGVKWSARLTAFEDVLSALKHGIEDLGLTEIQWIALTENEALAI